MTQPIAYIPSAQVDARRIPRFRMPVDATHAGWADAAATERAGGVAADVRLFLDDQLKRADVLLDLAPGFGFVALSAATMPGGPPTVLVHGLTDERLLALQDAAVEANGWLTGVGTNAHERLDASLRARLRDEGRLFVHLSVHALSDTLDSLSALLADGRVAALCIGDAETSSDWARDAHRLAVHGFAAFEVRDDHGEPELFQLTATPVTAVMALPGFLGEEAGLTEVTAPVAQHASARGVSFCIITDGRRRQQLEHTIASIHALGLPDYEIIVSGDVPDGLDRVRALPFPDAARTGRLGAMRNLACRQAAFDRLVVCDDDMHFHADFPNALAALEETDVLCVRLLNPDGTRYWDWATHGGPRGHVLLDYGETDPFVYVTGGLAIMHSRVHARVPWSDSLGFYAGEDLDWSAQLRAAGMRIRFTPNATVTHVDARYTQRGNGITFRQDLTLRERLAPQVEGAGFFRPLRAGGARWMSSEARITVAPQPVAGQQLRFALTLPTGVHGDLAATVEFRINGAMAGRMSIEPGKTGAVNLPIPANTIVEIHMLCDRSVPAIHGGVPDDRPISVLVHDVAIDTRPR